MIVDIHTHFLPGIDDGASDIDMSKAMLKSAKEKGVDACIATPHYYSDRTIEEFIEKRNKSYESLGKLGDEYPDIYLWAETYYTPQLKYADLTPLLFNGKLLLELPFAPVTNQIIKDIEYFISSLGIEVVIAHIERYENIKPLLTMNVGIQVNAQDINSFKVKHLLKKGYVDYIASDMHNLTTRPSNIISAVEYVQRKYPDECDRILDNGCYIIQT